MAKQGARTLSIRSACDHKKTERGPHSSKLDDAILQETKSPSYYQEMFCGVRGKITLLYHLRDGEQEQQQTHGINRCFHQIYHHLCTAAARQLGSGFTGIQRQNRRFQAFVGIINLFLRILFSNFTTILGCFLVQITNLSGKIEGNTTICQKKG